MLAAVLATGCAVLVLALVRLRSLLAASRAETDQLRDMVRKRVERPNVFSHEVRTPDPHQGGGGIAGRTDPGPLNERQREFVNTISVNAQQVIGLAQDLLVEARIESQLFDLKLETLDLRHLVRQTVRDTRRVHHTTIRLENTGAPLLLRGDRTLLGQAVWNLINNACRHAGEDVTVTVSVTRGEGQAIVAVGDDGSGMTTEQRQGLFRPFETGAEQGGTGLGMMITERIIAQHGGRLLVDTLPRRGTTIFFTLPLPERAEGDHD